MRQVVFAILSVLVLLGYARAEDRCDKYSLRVTLDPIPMQNRHSLKRWDEVKSKINYQAETVFLGDSLVEGWPYQKMNEITYGVPFLNLGVAGDRIQNVLWRLNDFRLGSLSPRRIIILLGTNNLATDDPEACALVAGLKTTVEVVQKAWPMATVYVIQILPRGADFHFQEGVRQSVNTEMSSWKRERYKFVTVDEVKLTCGYLNRPPDLTRDDCTPPLTCTNYQQGNLHLAGPGYDLLSEALKTAL